MHKRALRWNKGVHKTHQVGVDGHNLRWIEKAPSPVLTCCCGERYIKTRRGQRTCLFCVYGTMAGSRRRYR